MDVGFRFPRMAAQAKNTALEHTSVKLSHLSQAQIEPILLLDRLTSPVTELASLVRALEYLQDRYPPSGLGQRNRLAAHSRCGEPFPAPERCHSR